MTKLRTPVVRETHATQYERGRQREIVVSIEPPGLLGFRLKGTRRTVRIGVEAAYWFAMRCEAAHAAARQTNEGRGAAVRRPRPRA